MILYTVQGKHLHLSQINTKTSIRSMKNYTKERFLELLRKTDFPDYTSFINLNKAYQDFIFKLSGVIDLLCPIKKLRLKANPKPWTLKQFQQFVGGVNLQKIQKLWFRDRQRSFLIGKNDSSKISNKKK